MEQRVGSCSICGGDVMGYRGVWMAVVPPPPDRCSGCGAVAAADVIQMVPGPTQAPRYKTVTTNCLGIGVADFDTMKTILKQG